jgi:predicted O-methyltransferase YrrM
VAAVVTVVLLAPVALLGRQQAKAAAMDVGKIRHERNLYGHLMLKIDDHSVVLSSDTTTHGTQLTADEAARKHPTLYYTESSGVGVVLKQLQARRPQMNVGVVGLGAGTLAAYARTGDRYDFWDIDPNAIRVAREAFSYLADSAGTVNVTERDGRKALAATAEDYDVIVLDAFTGDGVPPHLLTREALRIYFDHLQRRDGLLVVHASTRNTKLFPVVEATGRTLGRASLDVVTEITAPAADHDWDPTRTEYVIVGRPEQMKAIADWFPLDAEPDRIKRTLSTVHGPYIDGRLIWSDERNAQLDVVELGRFLFGD